MPALPLARLGSAPLGGPGFRLARLGIAPVTAPPGRSLTLTLSDPSASWSSTGESSLFTSPGLDLTGAVVTSPTAATVTFTVPSTPGVPVVITDTSTGQTATLAVAGGRPVPPRMLTFHPFVGAC